MKRMKTLFTYALIIVVFWIFSSIASNLIIRNSYKSVDKNNIEIEKANNGFEINIERADSNKQQAYFVGTVKNSSNRLIPKQYVKVDSYFKGRLMQSKYLAFENLKPGEERKFKLLYNLGQIDEFKVSYVDEIPVNRTIVDDAIDSVINFSKKAIKRLNGTVSDIQNTDVKGLAGNVADSFTPVKVEGEDWQVLAAVLFVIYTLPSGFLFIF